MILKIMLVISVICEFYLLSSMDKMLSRRRKMKKIDKMKEGEEKIKKNKNFVYDNCLYIILNLIAFIFLIILVLFQKNMYIRLASGLILLMGLIKGELIKKYIEKKWFKVYCSIDNIITIAIYVYIGYIVF